MRAAMNRDTRANGKRQTANPEQLTIDNWPGRLPNEPLSLAVNAVADSDFFRTLRIDFVKGDNFKGNEAADSSSIILNETAVQRMKAAMEV